MIIYLHKIKIMKGMEFYMKILEKFVLILYSFLVLVISVVLCLVIFKIIDIETINNCIKYMLEDSTILITVLASSIVCILLSIRCLFFRKRKEIKKSDATDILLENESGRLLISKRAIERFGQVGNRSLQRFPDRK